MRGWPGRSTTRADGSKIWGYPTGAQGRWGKSRIGGCLISLLVLILAGWMSLLVLFIYAAADSPDPNFRTTRPGFWLPLTIMLAVSAPPVVSGLLMFRRSLRPRLVVAGLVLIYVAEFLVAWLLSRFG